MHQTENNNTGNRKEFYLSLFYLCIAIIWIGVVIYSSFFVPALDDQNSDVFLDPKQIYFRFGFNQLRNAEPVFIILSMILAYFIVTRIDLYEKGKKSLSSVLSIQNVPIWLTRILITLLCTILFWIFRSNFENVDFLSFKQAYPDAMARGLLLVRFDEMWETFLHFEAYKFLNLYFGLTINQTFQILSILSGSIFVFFALILSYELNHEKPYSIFLILLSGGFMQLFFGDMENYTLCGLLILLYVLSSYLFLKNRISLLIPAFLLILAMTFHMEAIYLVPSLIFLMIFQLWFQTFSATRLLMTSSGL